MSPVTTDDLLSGSTGNVEKELFMRALRPRLEAQPCYSERESICEIANTVEVSANEGYAPSQESLKDYLQSAGFTLLWVWLGCLITVLSVTRRKRGKLLSNDGAFV